MQRPVKTKTSCCELWPLTLALLCASCLSACTTSKAPERASDEIMGRPPAIAEDPFAHRVLPADAVRVEARGTIGEPATPTWSPNQPDPSKPELSEPEVSEPEDAVVPQTEVAVATRSEPLDPPTLEPTGHRCFSCVRICAESDRTVGCTRSAQDIICGWGTSDSAEEAMALARAECDATLDMARGMPLYSRIDGQCPAASCR